MADQAALLRAVSREEISQLLSLVCCDPWSEERARRVRASVEELSQCLPAEEKRALRALLADIESAGNPRGVPKLLLAWIAKQCEEEWGGDLLRSLRWAQSFGEEHWKTVYAGVAPPSTQALEMAKVDEDAFVEVLRTYATLFTAHDAFEGQTPVSTCGVKRLRGDVVKMSIDLVPESVVVNLSGVNHLTIHDDKKVHKVLRLALKDVWAAGDGRTVSVEEVRGLVDALLSLGEEQKKEAKPRHVWFVCNAGRNRSRFAACLYCILMGAPEPPLRPETNEDFWTLLSVARAASLEAAATPASIGAAVVAHVPVLATNVAAIFSRGLLFLGMRQGPRGAV